MGKNNHRFKEGREEVIKEQKSQNKKEKEKNNIIQDLKKKFQCHRATELR
jgi:hypothetical protein